MLQNITIALFGISLCLVATCSGQESVEETLKRVCHPPESSILSPKSPDVDFLAVSSIASVRKLIEHQQSNPQSCPEQYNDAFKDLLPLLKNKFFADVCSSAAFEAIKSYHLAYIHYWTPEATRERVRASKKEKYQKPIPEALRRFFILFAKQIQATCKRAIPKRVYNAVVFNFDDIESFGEYMNGVKRNVSAISLKRATNGRRMREMRFQDLAIIDYDGPRLEIKTDEEGSVVRLRNLCLTKLRPFYLEAFGAAVKLHNLGYGGSAYAPDEELDKDRPTKHWYERITVCELIKDVDIQEVSLMKK